MGDEIKSPKGVLDKLGVNAGLRIAAVGDLDASFRAQLSERTDKILAARTAKDADLIFVTAERREDLASLPTLVRHLARTGAIWSSIQKDSHRSHRRTC